MAERGTKHARPASSVSRDAKRIRDDETVLSDMSLDPAASPARREAMKISRKRGNTLVDDSSAQADVESTECRDSESETEKDFETRKSSGRPAAKGKVAKVHSVDSPSRRKRRVKGIDDPFITSPSGTKAKGKRTVDDSEDHEVGEEWTDLNGLRWRMGEDGELLREALVVEMRHKYPTMPKDSRHPDAKLKVPVLVERFLTEKEYETAKEKKLLSFQEEERESERRQAEEAKQKKEQEKEALSRQRMAESGRDVVSPKRVRDVQALYESPLRRIISPLRSVLPYTVSRRSRSLSIPAKPPSSVASPLVPTKRLSLSMGGSDRATSQTAMPHSTPRSRPSQRIPLVSPTTPVRHTRDADGKYSPNSQSTKRKQEEGLIKLLKEQSKGKNSSI